KMFFLILHQTEKVLLNAKKEMVYLLEKAQNVIPANQLWVNPDCGLKTRHWEETEKALIAMVEAAKEVAASFVSKEKQDNHWL
ncbi:MAG: hypothetical protein Q4G16_03950, partial [Cruoricaptor ignavus]|nr:hypothetical protein [Cruoricaptor ignavus]